MPLGVMVILLAYTLRYLPLTSPAGALPDVCALAATVGLHLWRRNAVLSIVAGDAMHIALVALLPTAELAGSTAAESGALRWRKSCWYLTAPKITAIYMASR